MAHNDHQDPPRRRHGDGSHAAQRSATDKVALRRQVDRNFTYHPPDADADPAGAIAAYNAIRDDARAFGHVLVDLVPPGRELAVALTKLEEVVMWANAGRARAGLAVRDEG